MHTNRISLARKILFAVGASLGLALLSGCETVVLTNLTPSSLPENPSQIYTITLRVTPKGNTLVDGSIKPFIIIDGQNYPMNKSSLADGLYEFEYQLPAGRDKLAYYFLVNYLTEVNNVQTPHDAYTELIKADVVHRYVLALEVNRGPVGARVSVLGRGFTPQDIIYVDGTPTRTVYESPNALSFFVPALEANRNYPVMLGGANGNSPVGTFRIDSSSLSVSPTSLTLAAGEKQTLTFTVPNAAPPGGLLLDVTTDVPESVIMPEVVVPQGQTTVTVTVESGKPGTGSLFLKGYGAGEVTIPVSVSAK
ncbi:MAG: cell surface protein [Opitutaceae bacterium]